MGYNYNEAAINTAATTEATIWDMVDTVFSAAQQTTEDMLDRYDDNVTFPKAFRAQRRRNKRKFDGPHTRFCRSGYRRHPDDRDDRMVKIIARISNAEMQIEAFDALTPETKAEAEAARRPLYAECTDFYYDHFFNPDAQFEHDCAEADRDYRWEI